jgi:hypothetical protein
MESVALLIYWPVIEAKHVRLHLNCDGGTFESGDVENALEQFDWDVSRTARALGVGRTKLYRIINEHGPSLDSTSCALARSLSAFWSQPLAKSPGPFIQNSTFPQRRSDEVAGYRLPLLDLVWGPDDNFASRKGSAGSAIVPRRAPVARQARLLNHQEVDIAIRPVAFSRTRTEQDDLQRLSRRYDSAYNLREEGIGDFGHECSSAHYVSTAKIALPAADCLTA